MSLPSSTPGAAFEYIALSVSGLERQQRFYGEAFGLDTVEAEFDIPAAGVHSVILCGGGGFGIELIHHTGSSARVPEDPLSAAREQTWTHVALRVAALDEAVRRASAAGGTVVHPPADAQRPGVRFAFVADPEGNLIELVERAASRGDAP